MTDQTVLVDRTAGVATITMSAPALTLASKVALRDALADVASDPEVRAVVLAGGSKGFYVGQDLAEHDAALADGAVAAFTTVREHYSPIVRSLMTMPKPVVAAVAGVCVGAGLGLAIACDYRVFSREAKLGTAFTGIGLTFDTGLSFTLPRAVGHARATELILFGRIFGPTDAIAWGIAGEAVDVDEVLDRAVARATELAHGPTAAFAETKRLMLTGSNRSLDDALEAEAVAQTSCGGTRDHAAAVTAFIRREKPLFNGQ